MVSIRLTNQAMDREIRKKYELLARVKPEEVGVDRYLVLNE